MFAIGIGLNGAFVVGELTAGLIANSMALVSDAGHNLSDVLGLGLAWGAAAMAKRPASDRFTFGLKKAPILAALFNAILLLVSIGAILMEAVRRLFQPEHSDGNTVIAVAAIGILINALTAWLFVSGRKDDINIRGAFLHMAADALVSAAVVIAGLLIVWTAKRWIDPVASILVALVILWSTFDLLKQSTWMTLAAVPKGLSLQDVERSLLDIAAVSAVHDLHVWPMSTTENALTAHLVVPDTGASQAVLRNAKSVLHDRFQLEHVTIQIETGMEDNCVDC
jgi:cobalt-zinc-cadmium efflux system protein